VTEMVELDGLMPKWRSVAQNCHLRSSPAMSYATDKQ